jgi:hypothetical protein
MLLTRVVLAFVGNLQALFLVEESPERVGGRIRVGFDGPIFAWDGRGDAVGGCVAFWLVGG